MISRLGRGIGVTADRGASWHSKRHRLRNAIGLEAPLHLSPEEVRVARVVDALGRLVVVATVEVRIPDDDVGTRIDRAGERQVDFVTQFPVAGGMALDVDKALKEIVAAEGKMSADAAADFVRGLTESQRYVRDVY